MKIAGLIFAALSFFATRAHAGAWTQTAGDTQIISTVLASQADAAFDGSGQAGQPVKFSKVMSSAYVEYGLGDGWTALAIPEFDSAQWSSPGQMPVHDATFSIAGGLRARLIDTIGVLSLQATARTAGAHDTASASDGASGREAELRLLYGTSFEFCGIPGFADIEIAERWIDGAQPDETPVDLTIGIRPRTHVQMLFQAFNVIGGSNARPPFGYYRSHKLQFSAVVDVTDTISIQAGGFYSPAGQNALREKGLFVGAWNRF